MYSSCPTKYILNYSTIVINGKCFYIKAIRFICVCYRFRQQRHLLPWNSMTVPELQYNILIQELTHNCMEEQNQELYTQPVCLQTQGEEIFHFRTNKEKQPNRIYGLANFRIREMKSYKEKDIGQESEDHLNSIQEFTSVKEIMKPYKQLGRIILKRRNEIDKKKQHQKQKA